MCIYADTQAHNYTYDFSFDNSDTPCIYRCEKKSYYIYINMYPKAQCGDIFQQYTIALFLKVLEYCSSVDFKTFYKGILILNLQAGKLRNWKVTCPVLRIELEPELGLKCRTHSKYQTISLHLNIMLFTGELFWSVNQTVYMIKQKQALYVNLFN